jgi:hypothetical protein
MEIRKRSSIWSNLILSGVIGAISYITHVILGGILWKGFNHITQTISELTGSEAPNASFLKIFTNIYGVCMIIFSLSLYFLFREYKLHKTEKIGAILLITMELTSFIGYSLFPLDTSKSMSGFQNGMHMVVTAIVVVTTISSGFFIAIGLIKNVEYKVIGRFILICSLMITISGALTPIVMANRLGMEGLIERINIFTLQGYIFVLSLCLFLNRKKAQVNEQIMWRNVAK